MKKTWLVFWHEYTRHVFRRRFIFALVSMPLFITVILGAGILATEIQANHSPVGYVDQSGLLAHPLDLPKSEGLFERAVDFVAYPDETQAQAALAAKKIQAYYLLEPDYLETSRAKLFFDKEPDNQVQSRFEDFLRLNLLAGQPAQIARRISAGDSVVIQSADGSREMASTDWFNILVPIVAGLIFMIIILTSGGYLLQAVVEEKENRTMEIIVTSVSPDQLMAGKILGNIGAGLTQIIVWLLFVAIGMVIGRNSLDWVQRIQIGPEYLIILALAILPAFVMIGGLMAALGSAVTEAREAQQISGLFTLPVVIPYWFTMQLMTNPNGPLALVLSFFPLTAPVTITLRAAFTQIPTWQLAVNITILWLCAAGAVWLAARTFRLGMLSYGKRISWRKVFGKAA